MGRPSGLTGRRLSCKGAKNQVGGVDKEDALSALFKEAVCQELLMGTMHLLIAFERVKQSLNTPKLNAIIGHGTAEVVVSTQIVVTG